MNELMSFGKKFILTDMANLLFRARHFGGGRTPEERVGMTLHILLRALGSIYKKYPDSHVIFTKEGKSWRKATYTKYKAHRVYDKPVTEEQIHEEKLFFQMLGDVEDFINKSNATLLWNPRVEADDVIAAWIQEHPKDFHVIYSTDEDFRQLISSNVIQFNGISKKIYRIDGVFEENGKPFMIKVGKGKDKTQEQEKVEPEWLLFEKCMRGDSSDNIMSAFPGVRKTKLLTAFSDRFNKGFDWNAIMQTEWKDPDDITHRVLDDYHRNESLIDLTKQPEEIRTLLKETVNAVESKNKEMIGIHFGRLLNRYHLDEIAKQSSFYVQMFTKSL